MLYMSSSLSLLFKWSKLMLVLTVEMLYFACVKVININLDFLIYFLVIYMFKMIYLFSYTFFSNYKFLVNTIDYQICGYQ